MTHSFSVPLTHTRLQSRSHTNENILFLVHPHTHSRSRFRSHCRSLTLAPSYSHSRALIPSLLTYTRTVTDTHAHTLTFTRLVSPSLSLSLSPTLSLLPTQKIILTITRTHSHFTTLTQKLALTHKLLSFAHPNPRSHFVIHALTQTHRLALALAVSLSCVQTHLPSHCPTHTPPSPSTKTVQKAKTSLGGAGRVISSDRSVSHRSKDHKEHVQKKKSRSEVERCDFKLGLQHAARDAWRDSSRTHLFQLRSATRLRHRSVRGALHMISQCNGPKRLKPCSFSELGQSDFHQLHVDFDLGHGSIAATSIWVIFNPIGVGSRWAAVHSVEQYMWRSPQCRFFFLLPTANSRFFFPCSFIVDCACWLTPRAYTFILGRPVAATFRVLPLLTFPDVIIERSLKFS